MFIEKLGIRPGNAAALKILFLTRWAFMVEAIITIGSKGFPTTISCHGVVIASGRGGMCVGVRESECAYGGHMLRLCSAPAIC